MSNERIKKYVRKYRKELLDYTFPEDYYSYVINNDLSKNPTINERRNRNVILNTPEDYYLFDRKFIYYNRLKKLNENILEWIFIYDMKTKFINDVNLAYDIYIDILKHINEEISFFVEMCIKKYKISFPIVPDTLVKNYIDVLMARKVKISHNLRVILENEYDLYYDNCGKEILDLFYYYQRKILSFEDEKIELYNAFREEVNRQLIIKSNIPMKKIKEKENGN